MTPSTVTLFEENRDLIKKAIWRNRTLLIALRLEDEDVEQELAIAMLKAIEKFDPQRSDSLRRFLKYSLQFAILELKRRHKPHGLTQVPKDYRVEFLSIDAIQPTGSTYEIAGFDNTSGFELFELCSSLNEAEAEAFDMLNQGLVLKRKEHKEALINIYNKYTALYGEPERMIA